MVPLPKENSMRSDKFLILIFIAAFGLSLAGKSADPGTPANRSLFELRYQASQIAASFPVDLDTARKWVPPAWNLAVDPNGMAKGLVTIISYPNHGILTTPNSPRFEEGQNIAPAAIAHFWFALAGPVEILPVPGATITSPTSYFYDVADFVTSKTARAIFRRAGRPAILVREISLVSWGSGQAGEITFMNGRKITLDAIATTTLPAPLVLGGNAWQWHAAALVIWAMTTAYAWIPYRDIPAM
ncbi:MAG: hypothetical protein U5J83_00815 [Bryobacterales bacterium]|nr:hypothetical protein [Bryobacterales bacterium]